MSILNLLLITVLVGLTDNTQVTVNDVRFTGFLESRDNGTIFLRYRQGKLHGEFSTDSIARIDFGYEKGKPFPLSLTLKNGQKIEVESEHRNFVQLRGNTDTGNVLISHPDPISSQVRLSTRSQDRKDHLTIQFLEFK